MTLKFQVPELSGSAISRPLFASFDVSAFQANIARVEQLAPQSKVMVVIKANAYGHGLIEMASAAGGRDLAVAVPDECRRLQDAGLNNRVWVLEGPFSSDCLMLSSLGEIVWVVHSLWQLDLVEEYLGSVGNHTQLSLCLKLNTGMNRLGLKGEGLASALERFRENSSMKLYSVMTHFAESDEANSSSVRQQISSFHQCLAENELENVTLTMSNSGAILFYPDAHKDFVRPGIMLYGGMPAVNSSASDHSLKPVMSLRSAVIAIQELQVGESVGYGALWRASRPSTIAVVACGYGDGYPRHAETGTPVAIVLPDNQVFTVPLVGRVSMDMLTIDVTEIADKVDVGTNVELWGQHVSADSVARYSGTISYELFCSVTERVPRAYL